MNHDYNSQFNTQSHEANCWERQPQLPSQDGTALPRQISPSESAAALQSVTQNQFGLLSQAFENRSNLAEDQNWLYSGIPSEERVATSQGVTDSDVMQKSIEFPVNYLGVFEGKHCGVIALTQTCNVGFECSPVFASYLEALESSKMLLANGEIEKCYENIFNAILKTNNQNYDIKGIVSRKKFKVNWPFLLFYPSGHSYIAQEIGAAKNKRNYYSNKYLNQLEKLRENLLNTEKDIVLKLSAFRPSLCEITLHPVIRENFRKCRQLLDSEILEIKEKLNSDISLKRRRGELERQENGKEKEMRGEERKKECDIVAAQPKHRIVAMTHENSLPVEGYLCLPFHTTNFEFVLHAANIIYAQLEKGLLGQLFEDLSKRMKVDKKLRNNIRLGGYVYIRAAEIREFYKEIHAGFTESQPQPKCSYQLFKYSSQTEDYQRIGFSENEHAERSFRIRRYGKFYDLMLHTSEYKK